MIKWINEETLIKDLVFHINHKVVKMRTVEINFVINVITF